MKSLENLKTAHRQLALQPLGVHPTQSRLFESQQAAMFAAGDFLRLPPEVGEPLADGTGALFFAVGMSEIGSADPIR
jgi:hypothetical protein